jgi:hypothetical protein
MTIDATPYMDICAQLSAENEALRAEVTKLERMLSDERAWVYRWHSTLAAESAKLVRLLREPPLDRDVRGEQE